MEFICVEETDGPNGEHWNQGDTYTLTRRDLIGLSGAGLTGNFEPVGKEAQALLSEVEALERKNNDQ